MALLTIPQVGKGAPGTITLNKTELFALPSIAADDYFSITDNVKKCIIYYVSDEGGQAGQKKTLEFDLSEATPSATVLISARGKNNFSIREIVLEDFDQGFLHVPFEEIPVGLGISTTPAPKNLSYSSPNVHYFIGSAISSNLPSVSGSVSSWSISPALPAGLSFNTSNGQITGNPSEAAASQSYTVTASNSGGSTTASIVILVTVAPPSSLSYSTSDDHYYIGSEIVPNEPMVSGTVSSWSISPALPSGLSFNTSNGTISGTPSVSASSATYTITATNAGGSTTANVAIRVTNVAPSSLSYSAASPHYYIGSAISNNTPSVTGVVSSWSISPALPSGLSFNTSTGVISGSPSVSAASQSYTVTASNDGGSTTASVTIVVTNTAPSSLSYSAASPTYVVGSSISNNSPTITGVVSSWSISPELPAGLSFNTSTGVISGTPSATASSAQYTVTASNDGGSTTATVTILVNPAAPSSLSYAYNNQHYYIGTAITSNSPTVTGTVTSWSISPGLPSGLSFNTSTGVISGTPSATAASQSYTITATNVTGSTTASVTFYVTNVAPSSLSYSTSSAQYTSGTAITNNSPTVTGTVTSWSISPSLPTGLSFNTSTGVISGTPDGASSTTSYTITASNDGGSTTATISISVAVPVWPLGTLGDLVVLSGQNVSLQTGQIYDYNKIEVKTGGSISISGSGWVHIGAKTLIVDGSIIAQNNTELPSGQTYSSNKVANDGTKTGAAISYTNPVKLGGAGGGNMGGQQNSGNGGGGMGLACEGDQSYGQNATATKGGDGGVYDSWGGIQTGGGAPGAVLYGNPGGDMFSNGGGGGSRGKNGAGIYIKTKSFSGAGSILASGQAGGGGGNSFATDPSGCYGSPDASGGGGGGAGGNAGQVIIDIATGQNGFTGQVKADGGTGGNGGTTPIPIAYGDYKGKAGQSGQTNTPVISYF